VTNYGRNPLYRNAGNGTFSDVTEQAGVGDARWGMGGAWFDYDGDGDLDLYVVNYLEFDKKYRLYFEADGFPGPLAYPGVGDLLYRNEGNGSFSDVTAGIQGQRANKGRGMSAIAADFDEDGRPDLFVANDAMENYLLLNRGVREGRWVVEDAALLSGLAYSASGDAAASMGGDVGDVDGDGRLDLVVPDNAFNNVYLARGKGIFEDLTAALGVAEASGQFWSWGVDLLDLDNDGDLDLVFSNGHGHLVHETQEMLVLFQVRDAAGKPRFLDAGRAVGPFGTHKMIGRGLCTADYDNDGDLDLFVLALDQPSVLARNDSRPGNHWLAVQLRGRRSNRDGIGALVTVRAGKLARTELRFAGGSFVSQHDPRLHFGLGPETKVDVVEVRWPSGRVQQVERPPVDRLLLVQEPEP
ncbi:MAG: CRTAC1 family protein, partial [Deltaproteobacteria bacterium]|nr:CRTAC1 family protein [Deltaproteobacteria bacterium]